MPIKFHPKKRSEAVQKTTSALIIAAFLLLCTVFLFGTLNRRIRPMLMQYAEHEAKNAVNRMVNTQVEKALSRGMDYESFVYLEKDASGQICAITADTLTMNIFKTHVMERILAEAENSEPITLRIPIGSLLGNEFLSGFGPGIPMRIIPFSTAEASYTNTFTDAGINQTRHQIMLNITGTVGILFPGWRDEIRLNTEICIAETVIVGNTPQFYAG